MTEKELAAEYFTNNRVCELYETFLNGNRKDAVKELLEKGRPSDLVRFGDQFIQEGDEQAFETFIKLLDGWDVHEG